MQSSPGLVPVSAIPAKNQNLSSVCPKQELQIKNNFIFPGMTRNDNKRDIPRSEPNTTAMTFAKACTLISYWAFPELTWLSCGRVHVVFRSCLLLRPCSCGVQVMPPPAAVFMWCSGHASSCGRVHVVFRSCLLLRPCSCGVQVMPPPAAVFIQCSGHISSCGHVHAVF
ncbi:hypothetical protein JZ751_013839, partial [Albula glossodonta]